MVKKIAVMIADGCEEIEALSPVDVLRRLGQDVDMVGLDKLDVMGAHQIKLTCDKVLDDSLVDYDIVVLPGGYQGATNLRNSDKLMELMQKRAQAGKWNAAMCAAPMAFARYGLLDDSDYTCYPEMEKEFGKDVKNGRHHDDIVVVDNEKHLITSRGPATALAYAYTIAEKLDVDTSKLKEDMLYNFLAANINK